MPIGFEMLDKLEVGIDLFMQYPLLFDRRKPPLREPSQPGVLTQLPSSFSSGCLVNGVSRRAI